MTTMTRVEMPFDPARLEDEWLEADGAGGFASGTVGTARTRRYHALLLTATRPPAGRIVLVNGIEAWLERDGERYPLTMQHYTPDVIFPDVSGSLLDFDTTPWPTWRFQVDARTVLTAEVFVAKAGSETVLRWGLQRSSGIHGDFTLKVRPLLSGRDYHALHHENPAFNFDAIPDSETQPDAARISWQPYGDLPSIHVSTNGAYTHAPDWYRNFCYVRERERGLDFSEDLATPGVFSFNLADGEAVMILSASIACSASVSEPSSVSASEPAGRKAVADYAAESAGTGNRVTKPAGVNLAPHATELANIEQQR